MYCCNQGKAPNNLCSQGNGMIMQNGMATGTGRNIYTNPQSQQQQISKNVLSRTTDAANNCNNVGSCMQRSSLPNQPQPFKMNPTKGCNRPLASRFSNSFANNFPPKILFVSLSNSAINCTESNYHQPQSLPRLENQSCIVPGKQRLHNTNNTVCNGIMPFNALQSSNINDTIRPNGMLTFTNQPPSIPSSAKNTISCSGQARFTNRSNNNSISPAENNFLLQDHEESCCCKKSGAGRGINHNDHFHPNQPMNNRNGTSRFANGSNNNYSYIQSSADSPALNSQDTGYASQDRRQTNGCGHKSKIIQKRKAGKIDLSKVYTGFNEFLHEEAEAINEAQNPKQNNPEPNPPCVYREVYQGFNEEFAELHDEGAEDPCSDIGPVSCPPGVIIPVGKEPSPRLRRSPQKQLRFS